MNFPRFDNNMLSVHFFKIQKQKEKEFFSAFGNTLNIHPNKIKGKTEARFRRKRGSIEKESLRVRAIGEKG